MIHVVVLPYTFQQENLILLYLHYIFCFKNLTAILSQYCSSCFLLGQRNLQCGDGQNDTIFSGDCKNFICFSRLLISSWINIGSSILLDFNDISWSLYKKTSSSCIQSSFCIYLLTIIDCSSFDCSILYMSCI